VSAITIRYTAQSAGIQNLKNGWALRISDGRGTRNLGTLRSLLRRIKLELRHCVTRRLAHDT